MATTQDSSRGIIIIGAGIIGCATAYYLTELASTPASSIHLIEASPELFASASGKAAGFLASNWFGPATASLGALSFKLHKELADKYDGRQRWGYTHSTGTSLIPDGDLTGPRGDDWLRNGRSRAEVAGYHDFGASNNGPAWLARRQGDALEVISSDQTTAQVDPLRLSRFLLNEALSKGVKLHQPASVVSIHTDEKHSIDKVTIQGQTTSTIPCSRIVITAGAWSERVFHELFPRSRLNLHVSSLSGHSVVVESPRWTAEHESAGCHAVFTTLRSGFSPEIFSRIGGGIYVAGLNDATLALPNLPTDAIPDEKCIDELTRISQQLLGQDGTDVSDLKVIRKGLCFRPVTDHGNPIISQISAKDLDCTYHDTPHNGVFLSAGHGPWGISHSLGTGKVLAEMIEGLPLSARIDKLRL